MDKFYITYHAIERLIERVPQATTLWPELKHWNRHQPMYRFKPIFDQLVKRSSENKSLINNTGFMASHYWDKYGFDSEYRFFESQAHKIKLVFVKQRSETMFCLATVVPFEGIEKTNKWKKVATKEQKQQERILSDYEQNAHFIQMGQQMLVSSKMSSALSAKNMSEIVTDTATKTALRQCVSSRSTECLQKVASGAFLHRATLEGKNYEFIFFANQPQDSCIQVVKMEYASVPSMARPR